MNKLVLFLGAVIFTSVIISATDADAQTRFRKRRLAGGSIYAGSDIEGMTITNDVGRVNPARSLKMASHNAHYSPQPYYSYSNRGINAGLTHGWNQQEQAARPWHGEYNNWRWGEPTALVVPPNSAYQTSYAWGVGQVRSTPIHHQFGRHDAGMIGGGEGMFSNTPYWPSSTDQFGVYPVRAPW